MQIIFGIIFHFIGGFASGSFYVPYKKVKGWHWESYWIIGGLFSWLIVPPLAAWLTVPDFAEIISQTRCINFLVDLFLGSALGHRWINVWLGMRYLGMSLGQFSCCLVLHLHLAHWFHLFITIFILSRQNNFQ